MDNNIFQKTFTMLEDGVDIGGVESEKEKPMAREGRKARSGMKVMWHTRRAGVGGFLFHMA